MIVLLSIVLFSLRPVLKKDIDYIKEPKRPRCLTDWFCDSKNRYGKFTMVVLLVTIRV